jgi:thymidylate synthase
MKNLKDLMSLALSDEGIERNTRTGKTFSLWNKTLSWNLQDGFPAVTSKKLAWKSVAGELLWFLSGSEYIKDLKRYTYGNENSTKKTIWCDDAARWHKNNPEPSEYGFSTDYVGALYGNAWRNFSDSDTDQITRLVEGLKNYPENRDHIVMAWNPFYIANDYMALRPCHMGFQCYVVNGKLNLNWFQRSNDGFLGAPFNIASYALLTHLLAKWTGLEVGTLSVWLGDFHIYENHIPAVQEFLNAPEYRMPTLVLPEGCETLESTLRLTASDFKDSLVGYQSYGVIKAPLSVG